MLENAIFRLLAAGSFRFGPGITRAADADDSLTHGTTSGNLYCAAGGNAGDGPARIAVVGSGLARTDLDSIAT